MVAPASITPGQSFLLTNITGSANTNIATVNSTTLTFSMSGATPSTVSKTWNGGPVHGDYTAAYSDIPVTATASAGSQITVTLISIEAQITLGGVNTSITCSVANGQLTANNPGETLKLATINVVAPAAAPVASPTITTAPSGSSIPAASGPATSTAPSSAPSMPATTNSPTSSPSVYDGSGTPVNQTLVITVSDYKNQSVEGAKVVFDSLPIQKTSPTGKVTFNQVGSGSHNVSIIANGRTISRVLQIQPQPSGQTVNLQIKLPPPAAHSLPRILAGLAIVGVTGATTAGWIIKRHLVSRRLHPVAASAIPVQPATQPTIPTAPPPTVIQPTQPPTGTPPK